MKESDLQTSVELGMQPKFLLEAYSRGYFPLPDPNDNEIVWLRPDPRAILPLDRFHCSRSLSRVIRQGQFNVTFNQAFEQVMQGCSERKDTWIDTRFKTAYTLLHRQGNAGSVEVWDGQDLVGGVYGVALGGAFFAESMFHRQTNASKVALYFLVERLKQKQFGLLEVQFLTNHLESMGTIVIPDWEYQMKLEQALKLNVEFVA